MLSKYIPTNIEKYIQWKMKQYSIIPNYIFKNSKENYNIPRVIKAVWRHIGTIST